LAAEALETARNAEDRSSYAPSMWSDGYLQLAAGEGLQLMSSYIEPFTVIFILSKITPFNVSFIEL